MKMRTSVPRSFRPWFLHREVVAERVPFRDGGSPVAITERQVVLHVARDGVAAAIECDAPQLIVEGRRRGLVRPSADEPVIVVAMAVLDEDVDQRIAAEEIQPARADLEQPWRTRRKRRLMLLDMFQAQPQALAAQRWQAGGQKGDVFRADGKVDVGIPRQQALLADDAEQRAAF